MAADDIHRIDEEEAQNIWEDALKPQKYDPLEFWNHIQSQVKKMMLNSARRQLEQKMTEEQLQRERALQLSQLDAISNMVNSTVAVDDVTEVDMFRQQLKMYME